MSRVALVTGANQGLGLALVQDLANRLAPQDVVYLASRSEARGQAARLSLGATTAEVRVIQLDVTDPGSITALANHLESKHGGVDIVASNAAARISKDKPQADQVRSFVGTNNHGSRNLYGALEPLLNQNARYVMVASGFGQLRNLPESLHSFFYTDRLSLDDIEASMDRYVNAMETSSATKEGWPDWINVPSKIGQVASARVAARDIAAARPDAGILINAACPGLLDTDASRPWFDDMSNAMQPAEAAPHIVELLLLPRGSEKPSGQLVQLGKTLPWL